MEGLTDLVANDTPTLRKVKAINIEQEAKDVKSRI